MQLSLTIKRLQSPPPQYSEVYYRRGIVYLSQSSRSYSAIALKVLALQEFNQSLVINPQFADAYYSR